LARGTGLRATLVEAGGRQQGETCKICFGVWSIWARAKRYPEKGGEAQAWLMTRKTGRGESADERYTWNVLNLWRADQSKT